MSDQRLFRPWAEAGFTSELLPIIPVGATLKAGSSVREHHVGKVPGTRNRDGTWSGLGGQWAEELHASTADVMRWNESGASVALQARSYLGLDIDVDDEAISARVAALAVARFGLAPERYREGSARRLLVYKRPDDHEPIRKVRLAWRDAAGIVQAVELLGHGQQFVVDGPHPKGGRYLWRDGFSPIEATPAGIEETVADQWDAFFADVTAELRREGWGTLEAEAGSALGGGGTRKGLDDPALWAPGGPEQALEALRAWRPEHLSHDEYVTALVAIKAALGPHRESYRPDVLEWSPGARSTEEDEFAKRWDSISDASIGWEWLAGQARAAAPAEFTGAEADFDEAGNELVGETSLERMLRRFVWVHESERYVDLQTGKFLSGRAFNAANTDVAPFGRAGEKSSEAIFQNAPGARKLSGTTYRPGKPVIVEEENAVNLWRPGPIVPLESVTDETVAPWLGLAVKLLGERGTPAFEHFMDYWAFVLQRIGVKINHALVLLGEQGVGKDTLLKPLFQFFGNSVSRVTPEELGSQFTQYLQGHIMNVPEMHSFSKWEIYNKLKAYIADPPSHLTINAKNQRPYQIPNVGIWVMTTNYDDALRMDEGDRRFWVHRCLVSEKQSPEFYAKVHGLIDQGHGAAKIAGWLMQRDISRFNPHAPPPMTEAKRSMLDLSQPPGVRWVRDQFAEGSALAGRSIVAASDVRAAAHDGWGAPADLKDSHITAALRAEGFQRADRVRVGKDVLQLWARDPSGLLKQLPPDKLRDRYAAERDRTAQAGAAA